MKTRKRAYSFVGEEEQSSILTMAEHGFCAEHIAKTVYGRATDRRIRRVSYVIYANGYALGHYRRGETTIARRVLQVVGLVKRRRTA